jgi:hypothetical protein
MHVLMTAHANACTFAPACSNARRVRQGAAHAHSVPCEHLRAFANL